MYINYFSQTLWQLKTSWIKALYHCSHKICSNMQLLNKQISQQTNYLRFLQVNIKRVGTKKQMLNTSFNVLVVTMIKLVKQTEI